MRSLVYSPSAAPLITWKRSLVPRKSSRMSLCTTTLSSCPTGSQEESTTSSRPRLIVTTFKKTCHSRLVADPGTIPRTSVARVCMMLGTHSSTVICFETMSVVSLSLQSTKAKTKTKT